VIEGQRAVIHADAIALTLPWPPSTNSYWRRVGDRTLLSRKGREYKQQVRAEVIRQLGVPAPVLDGSVTARIDLYPPDKRRRDIDNHAGKGLLDALTEAGVLEDDSQIGDLRAVMHDPVPGGRVCVLLARHAGKREPIATDVEPDNADD